MKPATEILLSAAFVLTPEENWTRHFFALNARRAPTDHNGDAACSWCMDGALMAAQRELGHTHGDYYDAYELVNKLVPLLRNEGSSPIEFNDYASHEDVVSILYKAAELSEAS